MGKDTQESNQKIANDLKILSKDISEMKAILSDPDLKQVTNNLNSWRILKEDIVNHITAWASRYVVLGFFLLVGFIFGVLTYADNTYKERFDLLNGRFDSLDKKFNSLDEKVNSFIDDINNQDKKLYLIKNHLKNNA